MLSDGYLHVDMSIHGGNSSHKWGSRATIVLPARVLLTLGAAAGALGRARAEGPVAIAAVRKWHTTPAAVRR